MRLAVAAALVVSLAFSAAPPKPKQAVSDRQRTIRVPVLEQNEPLVATQVKASVAGGAPARVVRVRSSTDDLLLLVVMDVTGDLARIDAARSALREAVKALPARSWTGLMRAQDGLKVIKDPSPDREAFASAVAQLQLTGKAALLDTVEQAVRIGDSIAAKTPVRVAVLYITDSDVRNYREDFTNPVINSSDSRDLSRRFGDGLVRERISKITDRLSGTQTPVFLVHLAYSSERLNEAYQSGLLQIAATTGGSAEFCRGLADIAGAVTRTVDAVQKHQQVFVELPAKAGSSVNVVLDAEGRALSYRSRFSLR